MKKGILSILTASIVISLIGCSAPKEELVKDREGNEVKVPDNIERIISTAPSNTEIIVDLGWGDKLVAIDTYSTDIEGIDKNIEQIDFTSPDAEAIVGLDPDLIIASGHNKTGSPEDPFKAVSEAGIPVVYIPSSDSIDGIYGDIEFIADILEEEEKGKEIIKNTKDEIDKIAQVGKEIKDKRKVYFEIAPAPSIFTFGNSTFLNEMIELIGAENVFKDDGVWISPSEEAVIEKNPDVILTNVNYIENPVEQIKTRKGWESINAIKNNQVYTIDTNSSSRPSHKITVALKEMAKAIYPDSYEK